VESCEADTSPADQYRKMAAELNAKAAREHDETLTSELTNLARCYVRLAEQADINSNADVWLEVGPKTTLEGDGA
jgi:hypothetical protein